MHRLWHSESIIIYFPVPPIQPFRLIEEIEFHNPCWIPEQVVHFVNCRISIRQYIRMEMKMFDCSYSSMLFHWRLNDVVMIDSLIAIQQEKTTGLFRNGSVVMRPVSQLSVFPYDSRMADSRLPPQGALEHSGLSAGRASVSSYLQIMKYSTRTRLQLKSATALVKPSTSGWLLCSYCVVGLMLSVTFSLMFDLKTL